MVDCMYGVTRKYNIRNENNESGAGYQKVHIQYLDILLRLQHYRPLCVTKYFQDAETNHPRCIVHYN